MAMQMPEVIVATPDRLCDLLDVHALSLSSVSYVVSSHLFSEEYCLLFFLYIYTALLLWCLFILCPVLAIATLCHSLTTEVIVYKFEVLFSLLRY